MENIIHPLLGAFTINKKIGNGSFATVYLCMHEKLQYPVAFKIFKSTDEENIRQSFNVTKSITQKGEVCLLMEYVEGKTLLEYANENRPMKKHEIQAIFGQLIIAVDFLHTNNIIHRDLKCENILIDNNKNIRLIDLNFSCPNGILHSTICGSPGYLAPEIIKNELYEDSVDIWSLGVILYAITFGRLPFENKNVYLLFKIVISEEPSYSSNRPIDANLIDLIKRMLTKNPKNRITIDEIKRHPFFTADSNEKNYIFSQQRMNYYIKEPISNTTPQMHILQRMNLTVIESLSAVNEIKSGKITYNSMTYFILYKSYISNVQIKNYSRSFQCIIHEKSKPTKNECDLPLLDDHHDDNKEKSPSLSHSTSYDEICKNAQKANNHVDIQSFLNSNVHFRRFSSIAQPLAGIRRKNVAPMKSVPQFYRENLTKEKIFENDGTISLNALPQLKINDK